MGSAGRARTSDEQAEGRDDRRALVALASVLVAVPAVVAAVRAVRWGWVPTSDHATIATRSADVLTTHPPDLGQLSGLSAEVGRPVRSPGPMGYWPFALTARWGPLWGSAVVAAGLAGAAMVASVRLAARRGGPALALAIAIGLVLSARAINPGNLASTWNPALGVMPLVCLVLLGWSVAAGEVRWLPVTILVASFCAQVHTVLALPALVVVLVAVAVGVVAPVLGHLRARPTAEAAAEPGPQALGRAVAWAVGVAIVCWILPIRQQLVGEPGNLSRLAAAGDAETAGPSVLVRVLGDAVGAPPTFVRPDRAASAYAVDVLVSPARWWATATALLLVGALVALAVHAVRTGRRHDALGPLLVVGVLGAGAVVVAAVPMDQLFVLTYSAWWLAPIGMLAWAVGGWAAARAVGLGDLVASAASRVGPAARTAGAVGVGLAVAAVAVLAPGWPEPEGRIHAAARRVGDRVVATTDGHGRYLVEPIGPEAIELVSSTAYRLRRSGARPVVVGNDGIGAGPRYVPAGRRCTRVVTIGPAGSPAPEGASHLIDVHTTLASGEAADMWVVVGPDEGAPSC